MPHGAADTTDLEDIVADNLPQLEINPAADPTEMMKQLTLSMMPFVRQMMELEGQKSYNTRKHLNGADQLVPSIMDSIVQGFRSSQAVAPRTTNSQRFNTDAPDNSDVAEI